MQGNRLRPYLPIRPPDARLLGDTLGDTHGVTHGVTQGVTQGDTHGDSVSPSCIPQLYPPARVQIPMQIQCASRSLSEDNQPRLAPRGYALGLPISPSVPDSIFRRFIVPSQIATHHHGFQPDGCCRFIGALLRWNSPRCASVWLWIGKRRTVKHELCTFVGDWDEKDRGLLKRNRFEIFSRQILSFDDREFSKIPNRDFAVSDFL